jgi:hypothetical protein
MADSCVPDNKVAKLILASCAAAFAANSDDCNKFLKAALSDFLSGLLPTAFSRFARAARISHRNT